MSNNPVAAGRKLAGTVFFNQFAADGVTPTGWRRYPNLTSLIITPKSKAESITSTAPENYGSQLDSYSAAEPTTGKLAVNQDHRASLAAFLLGSNTDITRASSAASGSLVMPAVGYYAELDPDQLALSGVTVTKPDFAAKGTGESGLIVYRKSGVPTIAYVDPTSNSASLAVSVSSNAVTVTLATDAGGDLISTAAQVVAAINAHSGASVLVGAVLLPGYNGSGVVTAATVVTLVGGGVLTPGVDYSVLDAMGMLTPIQGGAALPGVPHALSYTLSAMAGFEVSGGVNPQVKGRLKFYGQNQVNKRHVALICDKALLAPDGDWAVMGGDPFSALAWMLTFESTSSTAAPYVLKDWA